MVCNGTGAADLEPGTYYVCVGGGAVGMFNVTVTKSEIVIEEPGEGGETPDEPAHVNTLVVGDTNKIVVSGNTVNAQGAPIEWVTFVVEEKAHYEFVGDNGAIALIFCYNNFGFFKGMLIL